MVVKRFPKQVQDRSAAAGFLIRSAVDDPLDPYLGLFSREEAVEKIIKVHMEAGEKQNDR